MNTPNETPAQPTTSTWKEKALDELEVVESKYERSTHRAGVKDALDWVEANRHYVASQLLAQHSQPAMRWVKASERTPENEGDLYPTRYGSSLTTGYYEQGRWYRAHDHTPISSHLPIEYLDEHPQPDPVEELHHFVVVNPGLHPDTFDLVEQFASALCEKLLANQRKYGYQNEWLINDWEEDCRSSMAEHIQKGDPKDVAIYAAFMWKRGWSTAQPAPVGQSEAIEAVAFMNWTLTADCEWQCTDENQWTKDGDNITTEQLFNGPYQEYKREKSI